MKLTESEAAMAVGFCEVDDTANGYLGLETALGRQLVARFSSDADDLSSGLVSIDTREDAIAWLTGESLDDQMREAIRQFDEYSASGDGGLALVAADLLLSLARKMLGVPEPL